MIFCDSFHECGIPVVVYIETTASAAMRGFWICSSQEHVRRLVADTAVGEPGPLLKFLPVLPPISSEKLAMLSGSTARLLAPVVTLMWAQGSAFKPIFGEDFAFNGFLGPTKEFRPPEALIAWSRRSRLFSAVIAHTKGQAHAAINGLKAIHGDLKTGLSETVVSELGERVKRCDLPAESHSTFAQFDGLPGQFINAACVFAAARGMTT